MMEIEIALQPKQKEFLTLIQEKPIVFYGGARGGGKSKALQLIMLLRRLQYPGTSGAIFRRTYPELEANHIRPFFQAYPGLRQYFNESKKILTLPNGSTIQYCHCNNETDISLYQGREIEDLAIDEVGQWSEGMFRTLLASNRTSKLGIKPRAILAGNPGGLGHGWLKRLFVEKRFKEKEKPDDYGFVRALVYDNQALMQADPGYISRLEAEPNLALRKAWLEGSWDIISGQFFTEISREIHLIRPFDIPSHWNRFGAYDYGYNHPAAFGWFATDEDGNVYLYREHVEAKQRVDQYAQKLHKYSDTKDLMYVHAGWDCWAKKAVIQTGTTPTIAEEFIKHNIFLTRAKIDRIQGASQLRSYLAWQGVNTMKRVNKPRLYIFDTCPITFEAICRAEHDPKRPEDILKRDAVNGDPLSGDDALEMLRYGIMSRPAISEPLKFNFEQGSEEHHKYMAEQFELGSIDRLKKEQENRDNQSLDWKVNQNMEPSWTKWD